MKVKETTTDAPSELKPQVKNRRNNLRQTKELVIKLEKVIKYCMGCVRWEDAKPHVDLLEKIYGIDAPPNVMADINKVKRKFGKCKPRQFVKISKAVMKNNRFEAVNKITKNKKVKL
jgi:hypothetical protein